MSLPVGRAWWCPSASMSTMAAACTTNSCCSTPPPERSENMKPDRRQLLRGTAIGLATGGLAKMLGLSRASAAEANAIRPFRIDVPEQELVDLQRRLATTRWPDKETVTDDSQGVPLAMVQELVRYWQT